MHLKTAKSRGVHHNTSSEGGLNPFTLTDLFGMFQIKVLTIPFYKLGVERVKGQSQKPKACYTLSTRLTLTSIYIPHFTVKHFPIKLQSRTHTS